MTVLDKNYWQSRYQNGETGWDIGSISSPLLHYFNHLIETKSDKLLKILIPGAGSGYEAAYLWERGFKNVWVCDWAESAFEKLKTIAPDFPHNQMILGDFFEINDTYDCIIEQTFFCAINPSERLRYAQKTSELLHTEGVLVGVLFGRSFPFEGPPFGGNSEEYEKYFKPYFNILKMEHCYNSIKPRDGAELWLKLSKKNI